jgi:hypothetical protein
VEAMNVLPIGHCFDRQRELVPLNQESEDCIPVEPLSVYSEPPLCLESDDVEPSVDLINPLPVDVPQPADDDDRVPQGLLNELITQIKRFKEGSTNSLSETIEEAKKALDKRSSDGKRFLVPSNNPLRRKLNYHLNKAKSVKSTQQSPVEITSQRRHFFQEDVDKQWQDTFCTVSGLAVYKY